MESESVRSVRALVAEERGFKSVESKRLLGAKEREELKSRAKEHEELKSVS